MAVVIAGGLVRRYATITGSKEAARKYNQYECGDEAFHGFHFGFMDS
jgi:NADH:ubiquinone oxidoreductase subunit 3 (subunit A)